VDDTNLREAVAELIAELHGPRAESALSHLTSRPDTLRFVVKAYHEEVDARRRKSLVHCLWQYRDVEALESLRAAVQDPDDRVWKEALDGIVTLGGDQAQRVLREVLLELSDDSASRTKREWIDEAIEQIQGTHGPA
jgi:HEAT repeat protein